MELPVSRILSTVFATLFLVAVALKTVYPGNDPYRCRAVQSTGRWIDPPQDEAGNRTPFLHWQPDGCILHHYDSEDARRCLEGRPIVSVGDSTSRNTAFAFSRLIGQKEAVHDLAHMPFTHPHARPFNLTYHGQTITRLPNVWLSSHGDAAQQEFINNLDNYAEEKRDVPPIDEQASPALLYVSAGAKLTNRTAPTTIHPDRPNIPWKTRFALYKERYSKIAKFIDESTPDDDPFTSPMDPIDGLGNQIFYAPPAGPYYVGGSPDRLARGARKAREIHEIQDWLRENQDRWRLPMIWSVAMLTFGQNETWVDPRITGYHVKKEVLDTRVNILLNLRCNAKLDRIRPYPYSRTCCTDYGVKPITQLGVVAFGVFYLVACIICETLDLCSGRDEPRFGLFNMKAGTLVLALLMCYYADRTQMMAKGSKLWQLQDFVILCIPCIAILLITIRRTRSRSSSDMSDLSVETKENDEPFLSREQTNEWKGWMQFFILIYHWTGADRRSIYVFIRLCVAAYLFQTGYGHTVYFMEKKDFSFHRVATVLLRLNILSCALAYFMDTDYLFYYFSSLVSFWFVVVYATMAIGGKRYNSVSQIVITKICVSCLVISVVFMGTSFTEYLFSALKFVFNIQWNAEEWQYRVTLDMFIVYVGMLTAVIHHEMKSTTVDLGLRIILAVAGFCVVPYYLNSTSYLKMSVYRIWHPFISFLPILGFIALRNVSGSVRNYHSRAMAWLGRCSLETYILQFHLLLAGDTEGILIVDGLFGDGSLMGDRWRTLAILVPIFLWMSHAVAQSTSHLVKVIMHSSLEEQKIGAPLFAWAEKIPGGSKITAAKVRVACILMLMWGLNMMSPGHEVGAAPDGRHELVASPPPPKEIPY
ncbi:10 TM acyl transferase domain found in Cas1p-domain-containing protein [Fusarium flagelliforme]|uniref:10 TM acyl transferase domain found in Cas1p-domain-containing protein n=1 Tax=Fusarium flagelliforme TaxID=2675880 RepID=UPI001E8D799C|nr:10 TM acyl transferase domain found in Cas1p-domain-containing protein [Fusarium flagelliforme]KAH7191723.1 10 TM acyl transferase domain found in Cas1p-domain-containing protein [Fusarium flagelliforme]